MSSEQNKVILRAEHISKTYGEKKVLEVASARFFKNLVILNLKGLIRSTISKNIRGRIC